MTLALRQLLGRATSRWLPRSLGRQLMLIGSLTAGLSILLFGAWTIQAQSELALRGLEVQAAALARNMAVASENPLLTDQLDVLEEQLLRAAAFPQVVDLQVLDAKGHSVSRVTRAADGSVRAVFAAPDQRLPLPARVRASVGFDAPEPDAAPSTDLLVWQPIEAGSLLGWVRLRYSTDSLTALREHIRRSTVVACALAGLLSVGVLGVMLRRPVRAIDQARDFAVGLAQETGQQLAQIEGPEETVALALALNQASTRLHQQRLAIEAGVRTLQAQEAALADTNEQLRTIFSLSPDGLLSIDATGQVKFANEAFLRMTGLGAEQIVGQPADVLDAHLADAHRTAADAEGAADRAADGAGFPGLACFFAGPHAAPEHEAAPRQFTLARPSWRVLQGVGRRSASSSVRRLLYLRDITRESEIDRMKDAFIATAAHELRTPLTGLHGCVELLTMGEFAPPKRQQMLAIMHKQSQVLMGIVSALLELADADAAPGAALSCDPQDLRVLLPQLLRAQEVPPGREAPVWFDGNGAAPAWVAVDADKLGLVLRNLLSNAYKYSPAGGPVSVRLLAPACTSAATDGPAQLGIEVRDGGIGMTPEQVARACERFYRADASGQHLGAGLGLSIVEQTVRRLGGELVIDSAPGAGTRVIVWLPQIAAPAEQNLPAGAAGRSVPPGFDDGLCQPGRVGEPDLVTARALDEPEQAQSL